MDRQHFIVNTKTRYEDRCGKTIIENQFQLRHLLFLTVCEIILKDLYNSEKIEAEAPYGSLIGIGNSYLLEPFLKSLKIFRLHAAFHDAFGYCKSGYNKGPGYCYIINLPINSCFLGHITGLLFWIYLSIFNRKLYSSFNI